MPDPSPSTPHVSVILAVFDRAEVLRRCMECLAAQREGLDGAEVWVVGDGSPNPEAMEDATLAPLENTPARARFERRRKAGPAAQRNWAVRQSRGEILLFLNDDVEFGHDFLSIHLAAHARRSGHAAVGNTRWHPEAVTTPFMHWVAHNDSFYYLIRDWTDIGWEYVHTLNFSVHRKWFGDDPEGGFCEEFPDPAFEDTEWGLRMGKAGLKVAFLSDAVLWHRHAYDPPTYWKKTVMKGESARLLIERHPETRDRILGPDPGRLGGWLGNVKAGVAAAREGQEGPRLWETRMVRLFRTAALSRG